MNSLFNHNTGNITNINKSQSKEKSKNYFAVFSNLGNNQNRYLSENQRNLTKFNSQKKIIKKDNYSKIKTPHHGEIKNNNFLISFNDNNINNLQLKNYSNLISKNNRIIRNSKNKSKKSKNKTHNLSKPQLEIEINNINSSNNISTKIINKKIYKKNISEHDLVNNILNTFTNYNANKNINFSSKKKLNKDNNAIQNKINNTNTNANTKNKNRHASDTKLLRSSSGYSYINSKLAQTNSFFSGNNHSNNLGYISTWGNNPDLTNINFRNMIRKSNQKNNKQKNKSTKGPIIGKIIKNYKNNDLNCIFNMNLIPSGSPINNIQDYFKNLYKIEYNVSENRVKKTHKSNKKEKRHKDNKEQKERETEMKTKSNNDEYSQSKNTMTKTSDISKIRREKESIENFKFCNDSPEEIHFYVISSLQNGKYMINNLNKK